MDNIWKNIKTTANKIYSNEYFRVFWIVFAVGFIGLAIEALPNNFTLLMSGDYVLQTVPFYSNGYHTIREFFRTGEFPLFDFSNFLGANSVGANSFYYLFSPLFYLLALWPEKYLMQGIFFHMLMKYAIGGLLFYILLKKYFKVSNKMSLLGAIVYAFSGWSLFYLWFHYSDIVALFPLLFIGVERCLQERKGGLLGLSIFLIGITNYFFMVPFAILGVFYALYRWIYIYGINKKRGFSAKERWSVLGQGVAFYLAGMLMTAFVLIPSLIVASQSGRTSSELNNFLSFFFNNPSVNGEIFKLGELKSLKEFFSGGNFKNLLKYMFVWQDRGIYPAKQSIGYVISSFLFMNVDCWSSTIFNNDGLDNLIGGMFITTPLTLMLIPTIVKHFKTKRPWTIFGIIITILLPFIPFSYYLLHGFTQLYGRWQLFIVVVAIIFIISSYDKFEEIDKRFITINLLINIVLSMIFISYSKEIGTFNNIDKQLVIFGEIIFMLVVWYFLRVKASKMSKEKMNKWLSIFMVGEVIVSLIVTIEHKGVENYYDFYGKDAGYNQQKEVIDYIQENDDSFYRIFNVAATRHYVNLPSALSYNGASVFNSIYNFEMKDFIDNERMAYNGSWTMGYHEKRYFFDIYTGMKYYIIDKTDYNNDRYFNDTYFDGRTNKNENRQEYELNIPFEYELYKEFETYDVYINKNYIELGYGLDSFISSRNISYSQESGSAYEDVYTQMVIVEPEDIDELKQYFTQNESYTSSYRYQRVPDYNFKKSLSLREDCSNENNDGCVITNETTFKRKEVELSNYSAINVDQLKQYFPKNSVFFHSRWDQQGFYGDQLIFETNSTTPQICPLASDSNKCYINLKFKMGPNVLISLYNNDKLITQDAHMVHGYVIQPYNSEWKYQRGFYVNEPITKIVVEFVRDTNFNQFASGSSFDFSLNYLYEEEALNRVNNLKETAVKDVIYTADSFRFKTDYSDKKLVSLNVPYDDGWTLKVDGIETKIYKVNGGFIGFVAFEGNHNYELTYYPPGMQQGIYISSIGLIIYMILNVLYITLDDYKKYKNLLIKTTEV